NATCEDARALWAALCCSMTRRQRLRRVALLCCHCLRNLSFYRAGWRRRTMRQQDQFWVNANGNFLEICVLEWCKLFGDKRGKHYWAKVVSDPAQFRAGLLRTVKATDDQFESYIKEMRTYRDQFVAHLDDAEMMQIPRLRLAGKSAAYLYDYLRANEDDDDYFPDAARTAGEY